MQIMQFALKDSAVQALAFVARVICIANPQTASVSVNFDMENNSFVILETSLVHFFLRNKNIHAKLLKGFDLY